MLTEEHRTGTTRPNLDRNLSFELARVTEAAALASARWMGKGDKIAADQGPSTRCGSRWTRSTWTGSS